MRQHYQKGNIHFLLTGLIVVAGLAAWQLYQMRYDLDLANQKVDSLTAQVIELDVRVEELQRELQQLKSSSITGVVNGAVRDASNAILTGWEALIESVEQEVKQARDDLNRSFPVASPAASQPSVAIPHEPAETPRPSSLVPTPAAPSQSAPSPQSIVAPQSPHSIESPEPSVQPQSD